MKSTTARYFESSLTMLPELDRSVLGWTLTVITTSTIVLGALGWGLSLRAHAAEPVVASNGQQEPAIAEPVSNAIVLGEVVVPDCYYPPNPVICFTSVGLDYGSDEPDAGDNEEIQPSTSMTTPLPRLTPFDPEQANVLEWIRIYF